jgi:hypothetical protein
VQDRHTALPRRRRSGPLNWHQTGKYLCGILLVAKARAKNDNNGRQEPADLGAGRAALLGHLPVLGQHAMCAANSFFGRLDNFVVDEIPSIERMWPKQLNLRGLDRRVIGMRSASSTGDGSF